MTTWIIENDNMTEMVAIDANKSLLMQCTEWANLINASFVDTAKEDNLIYIKDGFAIAYLFHFNGHVYKFEVDSKYRGQGYGTKLFKRYLEYAKSKDIECVTLTSYNNTMDFYKKFGFIDLKDGNRMKLILKEGCDE